MKIYKGLDLKAVRVEIFSTVLHFNNERFLFVTWRPQQVELCLWLCDSTTRLRGDRRNFKVKFFCGKKVEVHNPAGTKVREVSLF